MNTSRGQRISKGRRARGQSGKFQLSHILQPEILLIEDGSGLLTQIGSMLQNSGFQVTLCQDAGIAFEKSLPHNFAVILVGAGRLDILAAVKAKRPEIKTMVVTSLTKPELPVQAYEMEIDDYLHWPLSPGELSGRIKNLFEPGGGGQTEEVDHSGQEAQHNLALTAMGSLVEGFTGSLAMIFQSLEDIRQKHQKDVGENLSEELLGLAAEVQNLRDNLRRCWQWEVAADPAALATEKRFH